MGFYILKTIISFNSGKIKTKKNRITIIITLLKTCLSPSEMQKSNHIVVVKKKTVPKKIILVHK